MSGVFGLGPPGCCARREAKCIHLGPKEEHTSCQKGEDGAGDLVRLADVRQAALGSLVRCFALERTKQ
eukprot:6488940-Amphidinium_carterae.1